MDRAATISELKTVVEEMHECSAQWIESISIDDRIVRDGVVDVFALSGCDAASKCFAWFSPPQDGAFRQTFAVLEVAPVKSAADAVHSGKLTMERARAMLHRN